MARRRRNGYSSKKDERGHSYGGKPAKKLGFWMIGHLNVNRTFASISEAVDLMEGDCWILGICDIPADTGLIVEAKRSKLIGINNRCAIMASDDSWKIVAKPNQYDILTVSGHIRGRRIGMIEFYWRPWIDKDGDIFGIIDKICRECLKRHDIYICGDSNTECSLWSIKQDRATAVKVTQLMETWKLKICHEPREDNWSWSRGLQISWLDIILMRKGRNKKVVEPVVRECLGTDHRLLSCKIEHTAMQETKKWQKINLDELRLLIKGNPLQLDLKPTRDSILHAYQRMIGHVTNLVASASCDRSGRLRKRVNALAKKKLVIRRKIKRINFQKEEAMDTFLTLCDELERVKSEIGLKQFKQVRERKEKLLAGDLPPWRTAELILGEGWNRIKDEFLENDQECLEASRDDFLKDFHTEVPKFTGAQWQAIEPDWPWLTRREWASVIKSLRKKKCKFSDYLDSKTFSYFLELDPAFENFLEMALRRAIMPLQAFVSKITLIEKANGKQVRPIAIMNCIGRAGDCCANKVLERAVTIKRLPKQWGFSRKTGTYELFMEFLKVIQPIFSQTMPIIMLIISFDLKNAFENFLVGKCIDKLNDLGIPVGFQILIRRMLHERVSMYERDGQIVFNIKKRGSFQCGFMSPTLFNVTTKDVFVEEVDNISLTTLKFADDMVVCSGAIRISDNHRVSKFKVGQILKLVESFEKRVIEEMKIKCEEVGLEINLSKTRSVVLTNSLIAEKVLKEQKTESIRILGLNLTSGRIQPQLIQDSVNKLTKVVKMFESKRIGMNELPVKLIPIIYDGTVNSILRYYCPFLSKSNKISEVSKLCTNAVRALCDTTNSSNSNITRAVLKIDHPMRLISRHWIKSARKLGFSHLNLEQWPNWSKNLVYKSPNNHSLDIGVPIEASDEWIVQNKNNDSPIILTCFTVNYDRIFVEISLEKSENLTVYRFEYTREGGDDEHHVRAALIEFLDWVAPLEKTYKGLIIVQCPKNVMLAPYRSSDFNYLNQCLSGYSGCWCIQEMAEYEIETEFSSCAKPNWLCCPSDSVLTIEDEIIVKKKIWREFRRWDSPKYQLDYINMLSGSWHRMTSRRTCICGRKLSTLHIIWSCKHMRRPEWANKHYLSSMKELISAASNKNELIELGEAFERVLRLNRIIISSKRVRFEEGELVTNASCSRWEHQPIHLEHSYHRRLSVDKVDVKKDGTKKHKIDNIREKIKELKDKKVRKRILQENRTTIESVNDKNEVIEVIL